MSDTNPFRTHEDAWEHIYGLGGAKHVARVWFKEHFPNGHRTSLRPLAQAYKAHLEKRGANESYDPYMECDFHPRALSLLVRYGRHYRPSLGNLNSFRYEFEEQPRRGKCFSNSLTLMESVNQYQEKNPMVYVEGLAYGYSIKPMLHAWNAVELTGRRATDWTLYPSCAWNRYLGIPFTQDEHAELCALAHPGKPNHWLSILEFSAFPVIEKRVREMLRARKYS